MYSWSRYSSCSGNLFLTGMPNSEMKCRTRTEARLRRSSFICLLEDRKFEIMQSMRINRFYKIPKRYRYEVESFKAINRQSRRWCRNINVYVKYSWCHSCWFVGGKDVAHNKGMNAWIKYIWMRNSSCYLTLIPWFPSIVSIDVPKLSVLDFFLRSNAEDFGGK